MFSVTTKLEDTLMKLAVTKLPKSAFAAMILPVKLAVFPDNSKLTVKLGNITLPLKLAVLPDISLLAVKLSVTMVPLPDDPSIVKALPSGDVSVSVLPSEEI